MTRTAKSICSTECGGRCCKWGFVELTQEEAERLPLLAAKKRLPPPTIEQYERKGEPAWVMHATPCGFLNKANLCGIYKDRPHHCHAFPDTIREWCPLSEVLFSELLPLHQRPPALQPKRIPGRRPRRRPVAEPATEADPEP